MQEAPREGAWTLGVTGSGTPLLRAMMRATMVLAEFA